MSITLSTTVYNWLKELKVPVSKGYLNQRLLSHPDYPSLLSITDTLDELGIDNTAIQIEKELLPEIPTPFMAHLDGDFGEFVTIKNRDNLDKQFPGFFDRWKGVVVVAEKTERWEHEQNSEWMKKEKAKQKVGSFTFSILALFIFLPIVISFSWVQAILMLIAMAGVFVSWFIVSTDIGIENKIADQICGKDADCNSVIHSYTISLPFGIGWSDAGIIYFPFLLVSLIIVSFNNTAGDIYQLLAILASAAIPVTIISIYYQWRIIKKWCRLCLITVALLLVQFFVLLPELLKVLKNGFGNANINDAALLVFLLFITTAAWLWLKPLLQENKDLEAENFAALRVKNNPDVFEALLQQQRKLDTIPFEEDLQLGNPDAYLQIMVACNPYCRPCAQTHKVLHGLVEKSDVGLTIRFMVKTGNKKNMKLQAAEYILQLLSYQTIEYKRKALNDWYELMNLERFKEMYPINESNEMQLIDGIPGSVNGSPSPKEKMGLELHERWTKENNIASTPTIFINGYELPKQYSAADLKIIAKRTEKNNDTFDTERKKVFDLF